MGDYWPVPPPCCQPSFLTRRPCTCPMAHLSRVGPSRLIPTPLRHRPSLVAGWDLCWSCRTCRSSPLSANPKRRPLRTPRKTSLGTWPSGTTSRNGRRFGQTNISPNLRLGAMSAPLESSALSGKHPENSRSACPPRCMPAFGNVRQVKGFRFARWRQRCWPQRFNYQPPHHSDRQWPSAKSNALAHPARQLPSPSMCRRHCISASFRLPCSSAQP